jgi:hypothetical protein
VVAVDGATQIRTGLSQAGAHSATQSECLRPGCRESFLVGRIPLLGARKSHHLSSQRGWAIGSIWEGFCLPPYAGMVTPLRDLAAGIAASRERGLRSARPLAPQMIPVWQTGNGC